MVKRSQQPVHPPLFKEEQLINPFHGEQGAESEEGGESLCIITSRTAAKAASMWPGWSEKLLNGGNGRPHGMVKCGTVH